jgi:hypothetical protein
MARRGCRLAGPLWGRTVGGPALGLGQAAAGRGGAEALKGLQAQVGRWWERATSSGADASVVRVVDMHTEGEPLRVVVGGLDREVPFDLEGDMLARRRYMQRNCDHLRTALMWEPRGHRYERDCLASSELTHLVPWCMCVCVCVWRDQGYVWVSALRAALAYSSCRCSIPP